MTVTVTEHYEMPQIPLSMPFITMSESGPSSGKPADSILSKADAETKEKAEETK